jgi:hypothetical protein
VLAPNGTWVVSNPLCQSGTCGSGYTPCSC